MPTQVGGSGPADDLSRERNRSTRGLCGAPIGWPAADSENGLVADDLELRYVFASPISGDRAELWAQLAVEVAPLTGNPDATALIVTDDFPGVVTELVRQVPWRFGSQEDASVPYDPTKADGGRAAGKTLQLAERAVIIVDAAAADLGPVTARRLAHHEARHARLRHGDDLAWAMHRRQAFTRPDGFVFAYVYLAQTLLDEYRCEAALAHHVAAADAGVTPAPRDWASVQAIFTRVRQHYDRTGQLETAFSQFLAGLDRIASFAGYAAAAIARGEQRRQQWADAEPVLLAADALASVPDADERLTPTQLAEAVDGLVRAYGHITERLGFRLEVDESADTTAFYVR
jgi:hypothetical protein